MEQLLTSSDAGRQLNLTPAAIRFLADTGRLRVATRTVGGIRLFTHADVERCRREREARRTAKPERYAYGA